MKPMFLLFALASAIHAPAQNLIVNGSFEATNSAWQGIYGVYQRSSNVVDGFQVAQILDAIHSPTGLYQTIPTTPGLEYEIGFALRLPELYQLAPGIWVPVVGEQIPGGGTTSISVRWNDRTLATIPVLERDWGFYTLRASADQSSTRLTFFNPALQGIWVFADAVSVIAVPEPSVCLLFSLSLSLLVGVRVCKNRSRNIPAIRAFAKQ